MPTEYLDISNSEDSELLLFANKKFISEVEKRPPIWDTTTGLYSDRHLKKKCWNELVMIFINKENPSDEEINAFYKTLQRKWKSARDCFNRECQRLEKNKQGLATSRKSEYKYYKNLSFLYKVMNKNRSVSGIKLEEPSSNDTSNSFDASIYCDTDFSPEAAETSSISNVDTLSPNCKTDASSMCVYDTGHSDDFTLECNQRSSKRRIIETEVDDKLELATLTQKEKRQSSKKASKTQEEDSDRLFLLSLHEPLKQIPKHSRMSVRVKIMQVIDSALKHGVDGMVQE